MRPPHVFRIVQAGCGALVFAAEPRIPCIVNVKSLRWRALMTLRKRGPIEVHRITVRTFLLGLIPTWFYAQTNDDAALGAFKALVNRHRDSYTPNGRIRVRSGPDGWIRERVVLDAASVTFDVEKTSSLVSPYVGTLSFRLTQAVTPQHKTKAEAAADNNFKVLDVFLATTVHKHVFAYPDQEWRPKTRTYRHSMALMSPEQRRSDALVHALSGDFPCDELLHKKESAADQDIHGCLEEFDDAFH